MVVGGGGGGGYMQGVWGGGGGGGHTGTSWVALPSGRAAWKFPVVQLYSRHSRGKSKSSLPTLSISPN